MPHTHRHIELHEIEQGLARDWVEILAAVLLALATVASAWSAYQSATWSGEQASKFELAQANRIKASEAADKADEQNAVDTNLFASYIEAYAKGDQELAEYYEENLFRDEMKDALEAWKETDPINNPNAPADPFVMPEYHLAENDRAFELAKKADEEASEAREAIKVSDRYVLFTVLFASVLFFAGISTKFPSSGIRLAVLVMGVVLFVSTLILVMFQPFTY